MSTIKNLSPVKGDIWLVDFDPVTGSEIGKKRPAVVISENLIGKLPLKIVVPITDWKSSYLLYPWFIGLTPSLLNGLSKESGVDAFQLKSLSINRFYRKLGVVTQIELEKIIYGVALCIGA
jgi:mRNA interferase MazF